MKPGNLVKQWLDSRTMRVGVVLRSALNDGDEVVEVLWSSRPYGRAEKSTQWVVDLELA